MTVAFLFGAGVFGPLPDENGWRYLTATVYGVIGFPLALALAGGFTFIKTRLQRASVHASIDGVTTLDGEPTDSLVAPGTQPMLVDCWAEWCGPCKVIEPLVRDLADHFGERVRVVKLDIDSNKETAKRLGIMGIPALILIKDGKELTRVVGGGRPKESVLAKFEEHLS
jgi:thioredoxin 1